MLILVSAFIAAALGSYLCSVLGLYISRLGLSTLIFAVAHAALAGAAIALVAGGSMTLNALILSLATAIALGVAGKRLGHARDALSMTLFSLFNAVAILAIYCSSRLVLAASMLSAVLWGSVLAVTREKLIALALLFTIFIVYSTAFRRQLDSLLFDPRLAEAEGMNIVLHTVALLSMASVSISLMLRIVGGFLVFTLLYVPTVLVTALQLSTRRQLVAAPLYGSLASIAGLCMSYALDLPAGVSIALANVVGLGIALPLRKVIEMLRCRDQEQST